MFRKRAHHFVILFIVICTSFSFANAQEPQTDRWNEYLSGPRSYPVFTRPWSSYLKINHGLCDYWASQMDALVKNYDQAAYDGQAEKANEVYESIYKILFVTLGENHVCFDAAAQSYSLNALFWLDNINFSGETTYASLPDHPDKSWLFAGLINKGYVRMLTPSKRAALGEAWSQMSNNQKADILGAYDCGSSIVAFDILQRPLDLGATIVHELDHLMRDKMLSVPQDSIRSLHVLSAQKQLSKISWSSLILMDEALAVSYASTLQLRYRLSSHFVNLKDDLNFSNENGPVIHIWHDTKASLDERQPGHPLPLKFHAAPRPAPAKEPPAELNKWGIDEFFVKNFTSNQDPWNAPLATPFDRQSISLHPHSANIEHVTPFYDLIYKSYFIDANPYQLSSELDPNWLSNDFRVLANFELADDVMNGSVEVMSIEFVSKRVTETKNLPGMLKDIDPLLSGPSSLCRGFQKALNSSQLNNYAGATLSGVHKPEKGVKGLFFGTKPEKGVKGTLFGLKPEKGVKGERSTVRPCINFSGRL